MQIFSQRVKPQTNKVLVSDERLHIEHMDYLKKLCMFPVRLVNKGAVIKYRTEGGGRFSKNLAKILRPPHYIKLFFDNPTEIK